MGTGGEGRGAIPRLSWLEGSVWSISYSLSDTQPGPQEIDNHPQITITVSNMQKWLMFNHKNIFIFLHIYLYNINLCTIKIPLARKTFFSHQSQQYVGVGSKALFWVAIKSLACLSLLISMINIVRPEHVTSKLKQTKSQWAVGFISGVCSQPSKAIMPGFL